MRSPARDLRRAGRRLVVVPTMGALHEGHLTLLRAARARGDILTLTIFVNPTQFGPHEDLAMYPKGAQTSVAVRALQKPLCGASRPGHFAGVATIVAKLFHITLPHVA